MTKTANRVTNVALNLHPATERRPLCQAEEKNRILKNWTALGPITSGGRQSITQAPNNMRVLSIRPMTKREAPEIGQITAIKTV
jgi:hypothetical protein